VLGDGDHRAAWRRAAGDVEEVAQLEVLQGALVAGDGVDVELDPLELASVKECDDGLAQPSLVGLGVGGVDAA